MCRSGCLEYVQSSEFALSVHPFSACGNFETFSEDARSQEAQARNVAMLTTDCGQDYLFFDKYGSLWVRKSFKQNSGTSKLGFYDNYSA